MAPAADTMQGLVVDAIPSGSPSAFPPKLRLLRCCQFFSGRRQGDRGAFGAARMSLYVGLLALHEVEPLLAVARYWSACIHDLRYPGRMVHGAWTRSSARAC